MTRWVGARGGSPGEHLPPPGVCTNLRYDKNGRVTVRETFETPTDNLGLPDSEAILEIVNATIDPEYEWPYLTNVHHLCYPRRQYHADPLMRELREGSAMMLRLPIQQHNLLHRTFGHTPMPPRDIAHERIIEQRHFDNLFHLGRYAIRFERWAHQLRQPDAMIGHLAVHDAYATSSYYETLAAVYGQRYSAYLERLPDEGGLTGLLPARHELIDMHEAIPILGQVAGQGFVDKRRYAQERKAPRLTA